MMRLNKESQLGLGQRSGRRHNLMTVKVSVPNWKMEASGNSASVWANVPTGKFGCLLYILNDERFLFSKAIIPILSKGK